MRQIFHTLTEDLRMRIKEEYSLDLKVDRSIVDLALEECDVVYGARPLRRFIEREITTAVARMLMSGLKKYESGIFVVSVVGQQLLITKKV